MIVDKVATDTIPVWKAKIIEKENIKELLDKIRAEIDFIADSNGVKHIHRDDVHRIIDKYRKGNKK